MAKLLSEGYTGYFIRTSNDEKDSFDLTLGETVLANEKDTAKFVKVAGLTKFYDPRMRLRKCSPRRDSAPSHHTREMRRPSCSWLGLLRPCGSIFSDGCFWMKPRKSRV